MPDGIDLVNVGSIQSHEEYSLLVLKGLRSYIDTTHVLLVQWDGYVTNPEMWDDRFLECDYIGAPWPDGSVGNGGFSLRSRRLLKALEDDSFSLLSVGEDVTICGHHRRRLEAEFGIVFADPALAGRFSFEIDASRVLAGTRTFGFHGVFNLFLVEDQDDLVGLISSFSDSVAASDMTELLLRNLLKFERFEAVLALGRRIAATNRESTFVGNAIDQARQRLRAREMESSRRSFAARIARRLLKRR